MFCVGPKCAFIFSNTKLILFNRGEIFFKKRERERNGLQVYKHRKIPFGFDMTGSFGAAKISLCKRQSLRKPWTIKLNTKKVPSFFRSWHLIPSFPWSFSIVKAGRVRWKTAADIRTLSLLGYWDLMMDKSS